MSFQRRKKRSSPLAYYTLYTNDIYLSVQLSVRSRAKLGERFLLEDGGSSKRGQIQSFEGCAPELPHRKESSPTPFPPVLRWHFCVRNCRASVCVNHAPGSFSFRLWPRSPTFLAVFAPSNPTAAFTGPYPAPRAFSSARASFFAPGRSSFVAAAFYGPGVRTYCGGYFSRRRAFRRLFRRIRGRELQLGFPETKKLWCGY